MGFVAGAVECRYIQMSGRAGRRGIDDQGIVIQMVDEKLEPAVAKDMLKGGSDPLNSTFHLGYNMLLNLYRVEAANPETMIISSFAQCQNDVGNPDRQKELEVLQQEVEEFEIPQEELIADYYHIKTQIAALASTLQVYRTKPMYQPLLLRLLLRLLLFHRCRCGTRRHRIVAICCGRRAHLSWLTLD